MKKLPIFEVSIAFVMGLVGQYSYSKYFSVPNTGKQVNQKQIIALPQLADKINPPKAINDPQPQSSVSEKVQDTSEREALKYCQSTVKDMTLKALNLEVIVNGLITNQEERTRNWLNVKDAKLKKLAEAKNETANVEEKLKLLTDSFAKRLMAIQAGYLKKCPCTVN